MTRERWHPLKSSHKKIEGQWVVHNTFTDEEKTYNFKTRMGAQVYANNLNEKEAIR